MLLLCADTKDSLVLVLTSLLSAISPAGIYCTSFSFSRVGVHCVGVAVDDSSIW